jgi:gliding motility-associated-like protein
MKKHIDDIFKDKLENFEAPVSDGLWDKIQQNPEWQQHLKRQKIRNLSIYAILAVIVISSCAVLLHQRNNTNNQDIETSVIEEEILTENVQETTTNQPNSNPDAMPTLTTDETVAPANPTPETTDTPDAQNATETMIPAEDNSSVVNPTNTEPTISQNNSVPEKSSEKTVHNNNSNNKSTQAAESNNKSDKTPDGNESFTTPSHPSENANPSSSLFSIPNAFTPNGDGLNDVFKPVTAASLQQYQLDIFAINGQHLFTSRNIEYGWNGEFQGSMMNGGNYIYVIKYRDSGGKEHIDKGQLLLIR